MGLPDPKGYCRKRFKDTPLLYLSTCCVGNEILEQIEAAVEEALSSHSWVEIMVKALTTRRNLNVIKLSGLSHFQPLLPSVFNDEDAEQIIRQVLKNSSNALFKDSLVIGHSAVTSNSFINNLKPVFDPLIAERANEVVASGAYLQAQAEQRNAKMKAATSGKGDGGGTGEKKDRKEERRKKANEGKVGGGVQGRETKTRATKKKYLKGRNDSDDEADEDFGGTGPSSSTSSAFELEFMSPEEIGRVIRKQESLAEAPDEFIDEIAARLHKYLEHKVVCHVLYLNFTFFYRPLQSSFQEAARQAFEALLASSSGQRRQTHGELQERLQVLLNNVKLVIALLRILPCSFHCC